MTHTILILASLAAMVALFFAWMQLPDTWVRPRLPKGTDERSEMAILARRIRSATSTVSRFADMTMFLQLLLLLAVICSPPGQMLDTDRLRIFCWAIDIVSFLPLGLAWTINQDVRLLEMQIAEANEEIRRTQLEESGIGEVISLAIEQSGGWAPPPPKPLYDADHKRLWQ